MELCTLREALEVYHEGAALLDNIEDDLILCNKQEQDGLVYYASFPDEGASTFTQAKFSDGMILECSISGQNSDSEWNFDELC